jgi:hypothetical protein
MPKVDINDSKGLYETPGSGLYRNGVEISSTASELDSLYLCADILDISSAANDCFVPCPVDGTLVAAYATNSGGTPGATATFTIQVGGTGTSTLVFASGDVSGTVKSDTTLDMSVTAGQSISLDNDGGASGARRLNVVFVVEHTT